MDDTVFVSQVGFRKGGVDILGRRTQLEVLLSVLLLAALLALLACLVVLGLGFSSGDVSLLHSSTSFFLQFLPPFLPPFGDRLFRFLLPWCWLLLLLLLNLHTFAFPSLCPPFLPDALLSTSAFPFFLSPPFLSFLLTHVMDRSHASSFLLFLCLHLFAFPFSFLSVYLSFLPP